MNVKVKTFNNWIHIYNRSREDDFDGCWFAYLPWNIRNHDKTIVEKMKKAIHKYGLIRCDIEANYYDTVRLYTNCKRDEIHLAKKVLGEALDILDENMLWVSNEESNRFKSEDGWLNHLNKFFAKYWEDTTSRQKSKGKSKYRNRDQQTYEELKLNVYRYTLEDKIMKRESMTVRPIFKNLNYNLNPNLVFVMMPFGEKYSDGLYGAIKELCNELSLEVIRADDFTKPGDIMQDIWQGIQEAGTIIADITTHNPNVFYELGIAHTIGKEVILLRDVEGEKSPFDIIAKRYVEYDKYNMSKFKEKLRPYLVSYLMDISEN